MISQAEVLELFYYNPMTGELVWKKKPSAKVNVGDRAGYIQRGHRKIVIGGKSYMSRNLIFLYMTGEIPKQSRIQHLNGDTTDERWVNMKVRNPNEPFTQDLLKEYLNYNPESGVFTWIKKLSQNVLLGSVAGSLNELGYRKIRLFQKDYRAGRLAFLYMTGNFPAQEVDHINRNRDDNRWENLRLASRSENNKNRKTWTKSLGKTKTSGTILPDT